MAGTVIALLHCSESSFDTRPASVVNSAPGGPTFSNRGNGGGLGGQFWFGGEGPFGQAMKMESAAGSPCALTADTTVNVSALFCWEGWFRDQLDNGREIFQISTDGNSTTSSQMLRCRTEDMGGGNYRLHLWLKQTLGGTLTEVLTSSTFALSTSANGSHIMCNQMADGKFRLGVDGALVGTTAAAYTQAFPGCYVDMFGSYDRAGGGVNGIYQTLAGEFRFTDADAVYTTFPYTVPSARFTNPTAGTASTATAAAGAATVASSGRSTARGAGTAAAGIATVSAVGRSTKRTTATAAAGAATTSAVGRTALRSTATAATGAASVSAAGAARFVASAVPANGAGSASASAASVAQAIGVSAGVASVSGAGSALVASVATAAVGTAAVSAITSGGAGSTASASAGIATTAAAGASKAVTSGQASGLATVAAVGARAVRATASIAAGAAAASAPGLSKAASSASATGIATVSAAGSSLAGSIATAIAAAGTSTVSAIVVSLARASGIAEGFSTVSAVGAGGTPNVLGSLIGRTRQAFGVRSSVQTSTRRNEQSSKR